MAIEELIRDAVAICGVPAPTGDEAARGEYVSRMFADSGTAVTMDGAGNVIAEIPGDDRLPCVALAAHLILIPRLGAVGNLRRALR